MLMRLFAPQFLVVWAFLGSAVAVHYRGKGTAQVFPRA